MATPLVVPSYPPPPPPGPPEEVNVEKSDWLKNAAIVALVCAGIIAGFAYLCYRGTYPREMLGGNVGVYTSFGVALVLGAPSGIYLYYRYKIIKS